MRSSVIWSFLSLVALATGSLVTGCDSDATVSKSGAGESCDSSADCEDGLNCLQGACYKTAPDTGGGEGGGDDPGVGPTPPVLGGEGESCTKAADCGEGLGCFNQRCISAPTGDGGEGNVPGGPVLGKDGETCQTSADCETGLGCFPGGYPGLPPGAPTGFIGVCSTPSGTITPSGKSCGAECVEDADCCELPVELHIAWGADVPGTSALYGTGANSCSELAAKIGTQKCATAAPGTELAAQCFAQAAYCECDDTWTCEAGMCNYTADCAAGGPNVDGCPNFTRSGRPTQATCNAEIDKCQPSPGEPACERDADCDMAPLADFPAETCGVDECICHEESGCYRACNSPLDCAPGYTCDDDTSLCKPVPACTSNAQCVGRLGARYACIEDMCQLTCTSDYDCHLGVFSGPTTLICTTGGVCEMIGCVDNDECTNGALNPVKMFCVENPEPAVGGFRSAITD